MSSHRPDDRPRAASVSAPTLAWTPMVAALAAAMPMMCAMAATPAAPAVSVVPVPSATWRVNGSGSSAPVNTPNAAGGMDQVIQQSSTRGIYNWQSFDIGAASSVTFDMAQTGSSALNRVTGSTAPSQIFGKLSATKGGEIFLINQNGILFGRGAQVDTGGLVASALNLGNDEYLSGFANSLTNPLDINGNPNPAFRFDPTLSAAGVFDDSNFVRVDPGASITTSAGGRVFLFAKNVTNQGTISTPDGQTLLAAGHEIYFKLPSSEGKLYASETHPGVSALRGFLVEVGSGPQGASGTVTNGVTGSSTDGIINTPRGNTTLVGMTVNQLGRINATTSVSENGSVILRAQGNVAYDGTSVTNRATESGTLTLGAGSQINILADTAKDSNGAVPTSSDSAGFATSHIDLAGRSVVFENNATILAPAATVNVRAEVTPTYAASLSTAGAKLAGDSAQDARIVMSAGSRIDVSGTVDTVASVDRYFVTTELLGSNDLKDAPVQKDGLLYRSKVTLDIREDSPILGSLASYRDALGRTVGERLSQGGTVRLRAQGAVLTDASSSINVAGGRVSYTAATVRPTELVAESGVHYDLNSAPADLVYTGATNLSKSSLVAYDRWGAKPTYGSFSAGSLAQGYVEGHAAGTLEIAAPATLLQGQLVAGAIQGDRQQAGLDSLASRGALSLGATVQGGQSLFDDATSSQNDAVLDSFLISDLGPQLGEDFWLMPLTGSLSGYSSGVAASALQSAGFQSVSVAANGSVHLDALANQGTFTLGDRGVLRLLSVNKDVRLSANLQGAGGSVVLKSKQLAGTRNDTGKPKTTGTVTVDSQVHVDLSGQFVNQALERSTQLAPLGATQGGSFVASGYVVRLLADSVVDVSGGGTVATSGQFTGASAGSVALTDFSLPGTNSKPTVVLGGELRGYSAAVSNGMASGGGSLSVTTNKVLLTDDPAEIASAGGLGDTLVWGTQRFSQGGFGSFSLAGRDALTVVDGAQIVPQQITWRQSEATRLAHTGTSASQALENGLASGVQAGPVHLNLSSAGNSGDLASGVLTVGAGALIETGPQSKVNLSAAHQLEFNGAIVAHGGTVRMAVRGTDESTLNTLWLGEDSLVDVSGVRLLTPNSTNGLMQGKVMDGGSISLSAGFDSSGGAVGKSSLLVLKQSVRDGELHQAQLNAAGASGLLDVRLSADTGLQTRRTTVHSAGGSISLASNGGLLAEGALDLHSGGGTAAGGSLSVQANADSSRAGTGEQAEARELLITGLPQTLTRDMVLGAPENRDAVATFSAVQVRDSGAADFSARSTDTIRFKGDIDLTLARHLGLVARGLSSGAQAHVQLQAANVFLGWAAGDLGVAASDLAAAPGVTEAPAGGSASLKLSATNGLVVDGQVATQGLSQLALSSGGDMRLQSRDAAVSGRLQGGLTSGADLSLSARQLYVASDTDFQIQADRHRVRIEGGDTTVAAPLSANASLKVVADRIEQAGVVRLPFGQISLEAAQDLVLDAGSLTSVSGAGLTVPYGLVSTGSWLTPGGSNLTGLSSKAVVLQAGGQVSTVAGSVVDVSGGGSMQGTQFVAGKGGSTNILADLSGAYAIVPSVQGLSAFDGSNLAAGGMAAMGRQIVIAKDLKLPDGSFLAQGRYTLLPASYAMLPGAFLLRSSSLKTSLAAGHSLANTDGSITLGAVTADAGTALVAELPGNWQLMSRATALRYSEVRTSDASTVLAAQAEKAGSSAGPLTHDAGSMVVVAQGAALAGSGRFEGAGQGQGGRAEFVADQIQVDADSVVANDGVLHLSAQSLNQLGAYSLLLGGRSGASLADGYLAVDTLASSVRFSQGEQVLTVPDLLATATKSVSVDDGARFSAIGSSTGQASSVRLTGDGAAVRLAAQSGAQLERTQAALVQGQLSIGQGVRLDSHGGSLVIDSTGGTQIDKSAKLLASDITLGGAQLVVGADRSNPAVLGVGQKLLSQVSDASQLTLRGYRRIELVDGVDLGVTQDEPGQTASTLGSLVMDTGRLQVADGATARVTAGAITLTNTTGLNSTQTTAGTGRLELHADASGGGPGTVQLAGGSMALEGAAQTVIRADRGIALSGTSDLKTGGDLSLRSAALVASQSAADLSITVGGVFQIQAGDVGTAVPDSAAGASLSVQARSAQLDGRIVLPSGSVSLSTVQDLRLGSSAQVDVAGRSVALHDQTLDQAGGRVALTSQQGQVQLDAGSRVDVSGAGRSGRGGQLSLQAAAGTVSLQGTLLGQAGSAASAGAGLSVDAGHSLDLAQVVAAQSGQQFAGQLSLRQRDGDLALDAGQTLAARQISLQADGGQIRVQGRLDASGPEGGRVELAARDALVIGSTAQVLARATAAGAQGGHVELSSSTGRLQLQAGSLLALDGGASAATTPAGDGGRLVLRAGRTGDGTDVAIDPLAGQITGAQRIDVQAVKVYDGIQTVASVDGPTGTLNVSTLAADAQKLVGRQGDQARAVASRLAGGNAGVAQAISVHAEAEIRSAGDLSVATGDTWTLASDASNALAQGGSSYQVGDSSVTLRAAGTLTVGQSIESGFLSSGSSLAAGQAGGSIRLVAGADLGAASATTVQAGAAGSLVFSREPVGDTSRAIQIRTTTGEVQLAAAGDVNLRPSRTLVYSAGAALDPARQALLGRFGVHTNSAFAWGQGAGDVRLTAGGSVLSQEVYRESGTSTITGLGSWSTQTSVQPSGSSESTTAWWSDPLQIQRGVASYGGGRVEVTAGVDVTNLIALSPSSGYVDGQGVTRYAGGSMAVSAGRDIVNGLYESGGASLTLTAGRSVARATLSDNGLPSPGTRVITENAAVAVDAARDVKLASVASRFLTDASWLRGMDSQASLRAVAASGTLALEVTRTDVDADVAMLLPADAVLAAPEGSINIGTGDQNVVVGGLVQAPATDGRLLILAGQDLHIGNRLQVNASSSKVQAGEYLSSVNTVFGELGAPAGVSAKLSDDSATLDQSKRSPVELVASSGNLAISEVVASARPVRLVAGQDVSLSGNGVVLAQHQPAAAGAAEELSLIQAGRDILFNDGMVRIGGGGEIVLLAGRDIDLGRANKPGLGSGLMAVGNTDNSLLPSQSAAITLVAGLRQNGADYTLAVREGFQALGSATLLSHAGDLYALLSGSGQAAEFSALSPAQQLDAVSRLMGGTAYAQALAGYQQEQALYVNGLLNRFIADNPNVSALSADILAGNTAKVLASPLLSAALRTKYQDAVRQTALRQQASQDAAPAALLADLFASQPQAVRAPFIAALAARESPATAQALQAWMKVKTGRDLSLADAIVAFEALPLERQVSWIDQVLVDEVRTQGRTASQAGGYDAEAAWLRGYLAINTVFSGERPAGEIRVPSSQVKTLQSANTELVAATDQHAAITQGAITLLAPGGGVNAGESAGSGQSANNLGVVTVAGGDIAAISRDDFLVNQSRVFSLQQGDIMLWSSSGDVDAGRGAKTVTGAPAPVLRLDPATGRLVLDTSGTFTGSGIAVLNAKSNLDLYAPSGAIDAGEAGIASKGNVFLGAQTVIGGDNISAGGAVSGTAIAPVAVTPVAGLSGSVPKTDTGGGDDDDQKRRRNRARRQLLLEFLGFGRG